MKRSLIRREARPALLADPFFRNFDRFLSDDIFRPLGLLRYQEDVGQNAWMPPVDVRETEEAYVFTAELPGLSNDEVEISLEDSVLTLRGERRFEEQEEEKNYRRIERAYGSFSRSFTLPGQVDSGKITAHFENGLLTVHVPKAEQAKPRKIKIT